MKRFFIIVQLSFLGYSCSPNLDSTHPWEKVEIELHAKNVYDNPYKEVEIWIDLKGPGFEKRCYGFWDGGNIWKIRIMATDMGKWSYESGSNQDDNGLNGKKGAFIAIAWTEDEKEENPLRRGMIRADQKGHSFEYADGTPMFWLADTWWPCMTQRYYWNEDNEERKVGTSEAGFKDYIRYRKAQGYNGSMVIAAFPNWTDKSSGWGGGNWKDEDGNWAFKLNDTLPDLDKLNPNYFKNMDKKVDYLNANGFIPFIETSRRDIGEYWKENFDWPDSYARYIRYLCFRYQGNIIFNSPIHLDAPALSKEVWNEAANIIVDQYDWPQFGHMASANPPESTYKAFGHTDEAKWLTFHGVGNWHRDHQLFTNISEMFELETPVPIVNNEPYYDGLKWGNDADLGSDLAAYYSRVALYGSVFSGALAGHVYGADHIWDGDNKMPEAFTIQSASHMQHIRMFLFSEGDAYQNLNAAKQLLVTNETLNEDKNMGWAYCMRTEVKDLFMLYFEKGCQKPTLRGAISNRKYELQWFNTSTAEWVKSETLASDKTGVIEMPNFPSGESISITDWAVKIKLIN